MSSIVGSSQVVVKKFSLRGKRWKMGKFALASGEEANNREKAREGYCPHY